MRISTITNWAYGITVILTALSAAAFIMSSRSAEDERRAVEEHLVLDTLTEQLEMGAAVTLPRGHQYGFMEVTPTAPIGALPPTFEEWGAALAAKFAPE